GRADRRMEGLLAGWLGQRPAVLLGDGDQGEELKTQKCFERVVNHSTARIRTMDWLTAVRDGADMMKGGRMARIRKSKDTGPIAVARKQRLKVERSPQKRSPFASRK